MKDLPERFVAWGAKGAELLPVSALSFDAGFRALCQSNACGRYGRSHMCPPDVGEIGDLIARAKGFDWVVAYQTVGRLEDSYDIEGMLEAGRRHNQLALTITRALAGEPFRDRLHLGAGGCRRCERCAKADGIPCRAPEEALSSLEAYGVDVTALAAASGLPYLHGADTVTYFGAYFYTL